MALLSEHVPVTDKLARLVGLDAYEAAGGTVIRDLFSDEESGTWLADSDLLRRLAAERMQAEAEAITAEGWVWVETFESMPYSGFYTRLSKAQIATAVAEGASDKLAAPLAKITKGEAVQRAAAALEGRGWLPELLRAPGRTENPHVENSSVEVVHFNADELVA